MPGFISVINGFESVSNENKNNLIIENIKYNNFFIERRTTKKFLNDKVFFENQDYIILTEGIFLNKNEMMKKYFKDTFYECITQMYKQNGNDFFHEFRGSFSGVIFDKKEDKAVIFVDQLGDKQLFYSQNGNQIIVGSEINYIIDYFNKYKMGYNVDIDAAYELLTFGYMIEDKTLFKEIKKVLPGHFIISQDNEIDIVEYHRFTNSNIIDESEDEIIENIDKLFTQAVKRAFEKDKEYGYKHLVALSGGFDSRMTTFVANKLGYGNNIVNYTFSQSDYLDEKIPKKIASDLKHEWIFKSLDNGLFLKDIDNVNKISSGMAIYYGMAHGKSCLDLINKDYFGIVHTGQLGDVILGTYSSANKHKPFSIKSGSYSSKLGHKVRFEKLQKKYENEEIFKFYNRGFNGINQWLGIVQEKLESYSPFTDIDFMEYCLSIPLNLRFDQRIYFKWVKKKYYQATKYKWERINGKVTEPSIKILGQRVVLRRIFAEGLYYLSKKINPKHHKINTKKHMNPLEYWYNTNPDIKLFQDNYYNENIMKLDVNEELREDCKDLYKNGNVMEKNLVLTLLSAYKLYFGENNE